MIATAFTLAHRLTESVEYSLVVSETAYLGTVCAAAADGPKLVPSSVGLILKSENGAYEPRGWL
jgi:hypothetical protein